MTAAPPGDAPLWPDPHGNPTIAVTFVAFDVLQVDGHDVTRHPWNARRALLEESSQPRHCARVSDVFDDGHSLFDAVCEHGLEGIVAKRRDGRSLCEFYGEPPKDGRPLDVVHLGPDGDPVSTLALLRGGGNALDLDHLAAGHRLCHAGYSSGRLPRFSTRSGGGYYGYKLQLAVCTRTGLPLAWQVETARRNESLFVAPLLDAARGRGFQPETCAMDSGYDNNRVPDECRERGVMPVVSLRKGRAIPLLPIPYGSPGWKRLYRGRASVERAFGMLKNDYGLAPLRCRGLTRVQLHADLTILARLGQALSRAREASAVAA